ncbi:hypothetical protein F5X99DRAFT_370921 [Biscogniauxia marginata]|nr:hypothetical protein F5X99DRAFT_370921 [Biscogniauxia marginata]
MMMTTPSFRLSLMGAEINPLPKKDERTRELERDEREIKKYIKKAPNKSPEQVEEERQATEQLIRECEFRRRKSIHDGEVFLKDFLNCHFEGHLDQIRISCDLTLENIKMIGNEEDQRCGVKQCRRLFNAPVLSDQIGYLLWRELRQGDSLDHSHEKETEGEAESRLKPIEEVRERQVSGLEIRGANTEEPPFDSPIYQIQRRWTGMSHNKYGRDPDYITPSKIVISTPSSPTSSPNPEPDATPQRARARSAPDKLNLPRKKIDCLMEGIQKRTIVGAGYVAASLASGYCL